ncbi:uracil-xanthine permease family protein [Actinoalloteichus spitiensis]|uniref:uracil-xanthine permease family protein n=1 Tax=Actinoalloteichus spitiensis TaxID=252394 RepID=UPI00036A1DD4|nr:solute carrier family 23 protein [Actinoalloteichus spitiensis]
MPLWRVRAEDVTGAAGVVAPEERLGWPSTVGFGAQHVAAMFSATVLVPTVTGFPVTTTLLFSGLGTLLFLVVTRNRVPGYLGASFAYVGPFLAAGEAGAEPAAMLGGVLVAGVTLVMLGVAVKALGAGLVEVLLPPVVTGAVVVLVGLGMAPLATASVSAQPVVAGVTLLTIVVAAVAGRGLWRRLAVVLGIAVGWSASWLSGPVENVSSGPLDAAWIGVPELTAPVITPSVSLLVLPVVITVLAENLGHLKAVAAVTGRDLDRQAGDVLIGNGLATALAGGGGGVGTTTYGENIGVMALSRVHSTAACATAAVLAVALSFSPRVGAAVVLVPPGVIGGAALVLFGLIAMLGFRVWSDHQVDFRDPLNLVVAGAALVAGVGGLTFTVGGVEVGGMAWGALVVVLLYPALRALRAVVTRPSPTR